MIQIRCDEVFQDLINEKRIRNILKDFLNSLFDNQRGISVLITNDAEIQKLNKQFRKTKHFALTVLFLFRLPFGVSPVVVPKEGVCDH